MKCEKKIKHISIASADYHIIKEHGGSENYNSYLCSCGFWHVGHKSIKLKNQIDTTQAKGYNSR